MSVHRCLSTFVALGAMALASAALGQSKPYNGDIYQGASRSAPVNNFGGYGSYENGYPASDMRVAVDANARCTWARQQFYRAQDALNSAVHTLTLQFESSPELTDALHAQTQAYEALLAARSNALKTIVNDPKYQANADLRKELAAQIAEMQGQKGITATDLLPYALAKLSYATQVTTMESGVLSGDIQVREAQEKLMAAGARVSEIRGHFDMAIRTNPDLIALRRQIDDARINYITAESFRDGAVDAACAALNYAYYHDRVSAINAGGYGSGYGYSYPVGFRY